MLMSTNRPEPLQTEIAWKAMLNNVSERQFVHCKMCVLQTCDEQRSSLESKKKSLKGLTPLSHCFCSAASLRWIVFKWKYLTNRDVIEVNEIRRPFIKHRRTIDTKSWCLNCIKRVVTTRSVRYILFIIRSTLYTYILMHKNARARISSSEGIHWALKDVWAIV